MATSRFSSSLHKNAPLGARSAVNVRDDVWMAMPMRELFCECDQFAKTKPDHLPMCKHVRSILEGRDDAMLDEVDDALLSLSHFTVPIFTAPPALKVMVDFDFAPALAAAGEIRPFFMLDEESNRVGGPIGYGTIHTPRWVARKLIIEWAQGSIIQELIDGDHIHHCGSDWCVRPTFLDDLEPPFSLPSQSHVANWLSVRYCGRCVICRAATPDL